MTEIGMAAELPRICCVLGAQGVSPGPCGCAGDRLGSPSPMGTPRGQAGVPWPYGDTQETGPWCRLTMVAARQGELAWPPLGCRKSPARAEGEL